MRRIFASLFVTLFFVTATVAIPALWLRNNIVDEQGFTTLLAPAGSASAPLSSALEDQAQRVVRDSPLPDMIKQPMSSAVNKAVQSVTQSPAFGQAYDHVLVEAHEQLVTAGAEKFSVTALLDPVLEQVPGATAVASVALPDLKIPSVVVTVISWAKTSSGWAFPLIGVAVGAAVLAFITAKRRAGVLISLGIALAMASLANWGTAVSLNAVVASTTGDWASVIANAADLALQSFQGYLKMSGIGAAGLVALGIVGKLVFWRRG